MTVLYSPVDGPSMHIAKIDIYLHTRPQSSPLADTLLQYQNSLLFTTIHFFIIIRGELPDDHVIKYAIRMLTVSSLLQELKVNVRKWLNVITGYSRSSILWADWDRAERGWVHAYTTIQASATRWCGREPGKKLQHFTCNYEVCTCIITQLWVCCGCDLSWLLFLSWPAAGLLLEATW